MRKRTGARRAAAASSQWGCGPPRCSRARQAHRCIRNSPRFGGARGWICAASTQNGNKTTGRAAASIKHCAHCEVETERQNLTSTNRYESELFQLYKCCARVLMSFHFFSRFVFANWRAVRGLFVLFGCSFRLHFLSSRCRLPPPSRPDRWRTDTQQPQRLRHRPSSYRRPALRPLPLPRPNNPLRRRDPNSSSSCSSRPPLLALLKAARVSLRRTSSSSRRSRPSLLPCR